MRFFAMLGVVALLGAGSSAEYTIDATRYFTSPAAEVTSRAAVCRFGAAVRCVGDAADRSAQ